MIFILQDAHIINLHPTIQETLFAVCEDTQRVANKVSTCCHCCRDDATVLGRVTGYLSLYFRYVHLFSLISTHLKLLNHFNSAWSNITREDVIRHSASFITEGTIIIKEPGESVILKCSSDICAKSNDGHVGMYLYHNFTKKKEVYYYYNHDGSKISARRGYAGRISISGTVMSHNITITNLTVDDSGIYTCAYKESIDKSVACSVYTVFVRGEFLGGFALLNVPEFCTVFAML